MRAIGDSIFGIGTLALCWFVLDLIFKRKSRTDRSEMHLVDKDLEKESVINN
ncbi:hypothetical protein D3C71_2081140 [compost metagenome]